MSSGRRVLVTGASGLLGATALVQLKEEGHRVGGIYHSHRISLPGTKTLKADLTDSRSTREILKAFKPEIIFHTAALTNIEVCEEDRSLADRLNVYAPEVLAQYAAESSAQLIHISTDAFFDGPPDKVFLEEETPTPMSYYAETKLRGEERVQALAPHSLIIRTNIYGWNFQNKQSLAEWMLSQLREKKATTLFKDVFYTPLLTQTLVTATMALVKGKAQGIFNVVSDRSISKLEFGRLLCKTFALNEKVIVESSVSDMKFKARRSSNMALSNAKLKATVAGLSLTVENDLLQFKGLEDQGFPDRLKGLIDAP